MGVAGVLLLTITGVAVVTGQFNCNSLVPQCSCSGHTDTFYELLCPQFMVHFGFHDRVQLQCNSVDRLDYTVLSGLRFGDVEKFMLSLCPLPDTSIRELMDSIGINKIKMLQIQSHRNLSDTLQKKHFEKLFEVTNLSLNNNGLTSLPSDLFEDMENLTWLDLKFNNIILPKEIFYFTPKLEVLELGKNNLTHLPPGIFKNLDRLRLLNLWTNNLVNLTRAVFSDVPNLESLDLNTNGLETIRPDLFADLVKLQKLNLYGNAFKGLPQGLLSRNIELEEFQMHENKRPLGTLPSGFLSNLTKLKVVKLSGCKLTSLPEDVFSGSYNIESLYLNRNSLTSLQKTHFLDLEDLEVLDLSENYITHLPEKLFSKTKRLKTLKLCYNQLVEIKPRLFLHLSKLEFLDLRFNRIQEIKGEQFYGLESLKSLNISDNQLSSLAPTTQLNDFGNYSVLQNCKNLEDLQLANNSLTEVYADWKMLLNRLHILNLAFNNIQIVEIADLDFFSDVTMDLSNNKIKLVNFWDAPLVARAHLDVFNSTYERDLQIRQKRIKLDNNPFVCDCQLLPFVQFVRNGLTPEVQYLFDIPSANLKCKEPMALEKQPLIHVPLTSLTCRFVNPEYKCPEHCICEYRPIDTGNIVNCQGAGLQQVPSRLPLYRFANHTELVLDYNRLTSFSIPQNGSYENVTHFHLSNNNIKRLNISGISKKIKVLDVSHNNLTVLTPEDSSFLERTPDLNLLLLHDNPWQCDCDTIPLLWLLRKKFTAVKLSQNITCQDNTSLEKLEETQLCPSSGSIITTIIGFVLAFLSLIITCFTALYYQYRTQIHIYCFSSKWKVLRWMVSHPDIDADKRYDAFISYAKEDEPFVVEHLIPELEENGETKFKLCVHFRDWKGGDSIPSQILSSVQNSRRTIVVLSPSFLKSVWGIVEFRTAHSEALKTGTSKVIVILKEEVGAITELEDELKAYLQMNTYVKWGSPWFWQQLKFALPHPPEDPDDISCFFGCFPCFPKISKDTRSHNVLQNVCLKDGEVAYVTEMSEKRNGKDLNSPLSPDKKSSLIIECVDTKLPEHHQNGTVINV
ncbi:LOW QUALITY PROTEIN: protein toll-like [Homalodisca vitripennis]|uniref:LOW QUALITY PROTEIN: protein toll-like n=1 Tax=Homalodisca vitripennis TaxID=197043 RepID=UPI001EEC953A|nr:LOW QUALITY PROTEIN: protein toll-like [Homalodisca vitripennis]